MLTPFGNGDLHEVLVRRKLAAAIGERFPASPSSSAPRHRSCGLCGRVPTARCEVGSGCVEDRIAAVRIADAKCGEDAVEQLCRHSPVPYFSLPRMPSTSGRPNSLASTTSIGRRSSSIMCGCEQPAAGGFVALPYVLGECPDRGEPGDTGALLRREPWRMPARVAAPGRARHEAVGKAGCHRAPRRGRSGRAPTAADLFSTSLIRPSADPGRGECLRRPRSSGYGRAALADIEPPMFI